MNTDTRKSTFDNVISDDSQATDTSMFNAEEIVKNIEKNSAGKKTEELLDKSSESRRRFEAIQEEKRLRAELRDLDDYVLDE